MFFLAPLLGAIGSAAGAIGSGLGGAMSALGAGNLAGTAGSLGSIFSGLGGVGNKLAYDYLGNYIPGMSSGNPIDIVTRGGLRTVNPGTSFSTLLERNVLSPLGGVYNATEPYLKTYGAVSGLAKALQPTPSSAGLSRKDRISQLLSGMGGGMYGY
jgi:hypothetical protein